MNQFSPYFFCRGRIEVKEFYSSVKTSLFYVKRNESVNKAFFTGFEVFEPVLKFTP